MTFQAVASARPGDDERVVRHSPAERIRQSIYCALCSVHRGNEHVVKAMPNPSLHPTAYSGLRPLPSAGELKR